MHKRLLFQRIFTIEKEERVIGFEAALDLGTQRMGIRRILYRWATIHQLLLQLLWGCMMRTSGIIAACAHFWHID